MDPTSINRSLIFPEAQCANQAKTSGSNREKEEETIFVYILIRFPLNLLKILVIAYVNDSDLLNQLLTTQEVNGTKSLSLISSDLKTRLQTRQDYKSGLTCKCSSLLNFKICFFTVSFYLAVPVYRDVYLSQ